MRIIVIGARRCPLHRTFQISTAKNIEKRPIKLRNFSYSIPFAACVDSFGSQMGNISNRLTKQT